MSTERQTVRTKIRVIAITLVTTALVASMALTGQLGVDTVFAQQTGTDIVDSALNEADELFDDATVISSLPRTTIDVYAGPSTDEALIRTAVAGTVVTVLGQDSTGTWLLVEFDDGIQGWVARYMTDLTIGVPAVNAPPLAPPATTAEQTIVEQTVDNIAADNVAVALPSQPAAQLNVRTGPSTAYGIIRTIPAGTRITVLGQDATGTWLSVQLADSTQGWVARFLTDFTAPVTVVTSPPLAPPATTAVAAVGNTAIVVDEIPISLVNVRSGPSMDFNVIDTVASGTQITVIGQDASGDWLSVQLADGSQGWIARYLTSFAATVPTVNATATTPVEVQPPLAPPATTANLTAVGVATVLPGQPTARLNVRSGPSTLYSVITVVPSGTQATVLGQDATGAWLYVQFADGTQGWIARFLTDFVATVTNVTATAVTPVQVEPVVVQPPLAPPATTTLNVGEAIVEIEPGIFALPGEAASVDNFPIDDALARSWQTLGEGQVRWYVFQHPGDQSAIQIWMDVEPSDSVTFGIFPAEEAQAVMAGADPEEMAIGHGTPNPNESGDLFYRANYEEHGTYYVMVTNNGTGNASYSIYGVGPAFGTPGP